jgi:predicted phage terminase large subunit-like protein
MHSNYDTQKLYNEENRLKFLKNNPDFLSQMLPLIKESIKGMRLSQYVDLFINSWDKEAEMNGWHASKIQDVYEHIWNTYSKSLIQAPREHLKTTSVLEYIIKTVHARDYSIEINYYHHDLNLALEKIRKMRRLIEANPLLYYGLGLDEATSLKEDLIVFKDGTVIQPLSWKTGVVGKHPHIIILDDVIDKSVIYSDDMNKKAIEKFYLDIQPMITKMTDVKKIIVIGTVQRKDDVYAALPKDFYRIKLGAFKDNFEQKPLAPDLYTRQDLLKMKESILSNPLEGGERFWLKEYMNIPFDRLGTIVKSSHIHPYYDPPKDLVIYQGWDLSVAKDLEKSDWTCGVTIGVQHLPDNTIKVYILNVFRKRLNFAQRIQAVKDQYQLFHPSNVGIESVAFQYDTIQTLMAETLIPIVEIKAIKNKIESFQTELGPYFERGQVFVQPLAPWYPDYVNELLALPTGSFDDQADATKIAIKTALFNYIEDPESSKQTEDEDFSIVAGVDSMVF